jgi:hypothetical protein
MTMVCVVCRHPRRIDIDRAVIAGAGYRVIASQFGVGRSAVMRHKADHLLPELLKAKQVEDVSRATDLLAMVIERDRRAMALLDRADAEGDLRPAASLMRVSLTAIELLAKLRGELDERAVINVLALPEWLAVREALLIALDPFPQARIAVGEALAQVEGANHGS